MCKNTGIVARAKLQESEGAFIGRIGGVGHLEELNSIIHGGVGADTGVVSLLVTIVALDVRVSFSICAGKGGTSL